jgi:hypothetical protein
MWELIAQAAAAGFRDLNVAAGRDARAAEEESGRQTLGAPRRLKKWLGPLVAALVVLAVVALVLFFGLLQGGQRAARPSTPAQPPAQPPVPSAYLMHYGGAALVQPTLETADASDARDASAECAAAPLGPLLPAAPPPLDEPRSRDGEPPWRSLLLVLGMVVAGAVVIYWAVRKLIQLIQDRNDARAALANAHNTIFELNQAAVSESAVHEATLGELEAANTTITELRGELDAERAAHAAALHQLQQADQETAANHQLQNGLVNVPLQLLQPAAAPATPAAVVANGTMTAAPAVPAAPAIPTTLGEWRALSEQGRWPTYQKVFAVWRKGHMRPELLRPVDNYGNSEIISATYRVLNGKMPKRPLSPQAFAAAMNATTLDDMVAIIIGGAA